MQKRVHSTATLASRIVTHYPQWRPEIFTRDVGLEKNDRLGTMHTSDHRRSVWHIKISDFTPSCETLGRLLLKKSDDEIAISRVERRRFVMTRKAFLWLEKGP